MLCTQRVPQALPVSRSKNCVFQPKTVWNQKAPRAASKLKAVQDATSTQTAWPAEQQTSRSKNGHAMEHKGQDQAQAAPSASAPFTWVRNWWPTLSEDMLHKDKPNAVTILNRDLVVWWDKKQEQWVVVQDSCPHRLAPLSQGRLTDSGLTCSYHGWSFNATGSCTSIPQLEGPQQLQHGTSSALMSSKRACARVYPSKMVDGIVFAWLDDSEEGLALSRSTEPYTPEEFKGTKGVWGINQLFNDYAFWVEQSMDPSHANFLHAGVGVFDPAHAVPMDATPIPPDGLTVDGGFAWHHGGYETKNLGMKAVRAFKPPFSVRTTYMYPNGFGLLFFIMVVPVRPGVCRTYFRMTTYSGSSSSTASSQEQPKQGAAVAKDSSKPDSKGDSGPKPVSGVAGLMSVFMSYAMKKSADLPHWVLQNQALTDQDTVIMHLQEHGILKQGQSDQDYTMIAEADGGVTAINRWMRMVDYKNMWQHVAGLQPGTNGSKLPVSEQQSLEKLLDRRARHVDHCALCQKALKAVEQAEALLKALTFTFAASSFGFLAVALTSWGQAATAAMSVSGIPGSAIAAAVAAAAAGLFAVWTQKLEGFKENRFTSGVKSWQKSGGLSLVKL